MDGFVAPPRRASRGTVEEGAQGHPRPGATDGARFAFRLASLGRTAKDARIVEELYEHTIDVILRAEALERYEALPAQDIFDVEYWDLEQTKLKKAGRPPPFAGEVAWVTGAASGIGKAAVAALLARRGRRRARSQSRGRDHARDDFLGLACDVTDERAIAAALERTARRWRAGHAGPERWHLRATRSIKDLGTDEWRKVMTVNLDANLLLMRACHPYRARAEGGRRRGDRIEERPRPGPARPRTPRPRRG